MDYKVIKNELTDRIVDAVFLPVHMKLREGSEASSTIFEKEEDEKRKREGKSAGKCEVGRVVCIRGDHQEIAYIIHAVDLQRKNGNCNEEDLLCETYAYAFTLADQLQCESLAIPLLTTEEQGVSPVVSYEAVQKTIPSFTDTHSLKCVYLVICDTETATLLQKNHIEIPEEINQEFPMDPALNQG